MKCKTLELLRLYSCNKLKAEIQNPSRGQDSDKSTTVRTQELENRDRLEPMAQKEQEAVALTPLTATRGQEAPLAQALAQAPL